MAKKKFWMKRSLVPTDPPAQAMQTVTLRWREPAAFGAKQCQKTIGPNDVLEGEKWEQFVPEFLEPVSEEKEEKAEYEKPSGKTTTKTAGAKGKK